MAFLANARHIHFIGIGGIGLSALARVLLAQGYTVSGSDPSSNALTAELAQLGARIFAEHRAENVNGADLVVATSAATAENPEIRAAHARGIAVLKRREFLQELTSGFRTIAVAGSHGKTTTTALIGLILLEAGFDPTMIVGGVVPELGSNARAGSGEFLVIEADEYDYAFLGLRPHLAVVTNVDYDHPDLFATRSAYREAFGEFVSRVRVNGTLLVCGDDTVAREIAIGLPARLLHYGRGEANEWRATDVQVNESGGCDFVVWREDERLGGVRVQIPGEHNVLNALAALAATNGVGANWDSARKTVEQFRGVERRLQVRGEFNGATIVDTYAHHPTEIRADLEAMRARFPGRNVWAVFQPHTYTRTRALLDEFAGAFARADHVIVTEVYASRERDSLGVTGRDIVMRMKHADARFIPTLGLVVEYLSQHLQQGDVLLTLGAGDVNRVAQRLMDLDHA